MWHKTALIAVALVLAFPAFAGNPSKSNTTIKPTKLTKPTKPSLGNTHPVRTDTGMVEQQNFQYQPNRVVQNGPSGRVNPPVNAQINCQQPNPPRSCAQAKPPH